MLYKFIILSLGICALTSCTAKKKQVETQGTEINQRDTKVEKIELSEGNEKWLTKYPLRIKFRAITEDSRCPEGVDCIWAGVAVAQIEVIEKGGQPYSVNLATTAMPAKGYKTSAEVNGYTIALESLAPYPKAQHTTKTLKGSYKIAIIVQQKSN
ncbi:hypothetical protein [Sphingobacterium kitahiroshimense]|uniref:Lipoprotein n=1 Tax=Sphingobacterium kitahiroshimense TaxID=470446 RepID=A0ABV0BY95_9SPHI